jgi:hypothetical protein
MHRWRATVFAWLVFVSPFLEFAAAQEIGEGGVKFSKRKLIVSPYESCAVADINRDGHLDIVYGAYWFAGPDWLPYAIRPNHTAAEYMRANSDHIYDVDGDGWLDVIAGGWNEDGIYWYKNPGNGPAERGEPWEMHLPWEAHLLDKTRGNMEMFVLRDYDGDGIPELHSASYRRENPLEVFRFAKDADGATIMKPTVIGREGGGHGVAFGDVNGDGREDVLCEMGLYALQEVDPYARTWNYNPETYL